MIAEVLVEVRVEARDAVGLLARRAPEGLTEVELELPEGDEVHEDVPSAVEGHIADEDIIEALRIAVVAQLELLDLQT